MVRCDICGKDELLPFICSYCGKSLCSEHRLPENHDCQAAFKNQPINMKESIRSFQKPRLFWASFRTSKTELFHLAIGIFIFFLVSGLRFILAWPSIRLIALVAIGVILSFVPHELAHKFMAQHYHLWSEFRLDPFMAILSLFTAIPWIPIKLIAPGAVQIFGYSITIEQIGKISLSGPLINLIQAVLFKGLSTYMPELIFFAVLNSDLAVFNLIPLSVLDGKKVFSWNKIGWTITFAMAMVVWIFML